MALILDGTAGITTPAISNSGNLTFTGTGNRITGDFSNATHANRVAFQTSVTNGATSPFIIPNGTGTTASIVVANASDPTNSSFGQFIVGTTDVRILAGTLGTGTSLPITFYTGGSERMRIDTSGNVGIGTNSITSTAGYTSVELNNATYGGLIRFSSNGVSKGVVYNDANNFFLYSNSGVPMIFQAAGTDRMRIDSSGNLLVGTTTNNTNCKIVASANSGVSSGIEVQTNNSAANAAMYFYNPNGIVGSIITNGSATSFNTSSDYRLKENVQPMQNALARNSLLKPCTYQWKVDGSTGEGFIAHELQAVCPNAVTGEKDAVDKDGNPVYQGVDTSFLVGHLVACINELKAEIDELKAKVN